MNLPISRRLDFSEIPLIDVSVLMKEDVSAEQLNSTVENLRNACSNVGFFYVKNHGFSPSLIDNVINSGREFFLQSDEEKSKISIDHRIRGYLPLRYRSYEGEDRAGTSHQEGFWMGYDTATNVDRPLDGPNQWPQGSPNFRSAMNDYFREVERLSQCLQKGFALALGLDADFFQPFFDCPTSRLKINHYPVQEGEITENNLGVVPHTDSGGYTILWQDNQGGLEIQSKSGEWVGATPIENTFVINIGNIMQYWSNGEFSSTPHRVINRQGGDRFSIPLFVNPNYEVDIKPLVETDTPAFEPFSYGDYQLDLWRRTFPIANIPQ